MSPGARAGGVAVGAWVAARRQDYWNGRLDRTRAESLEALPGWDWSGRHQRRWFTVFAALTRFVATHDVAEIEPGLVIKRVRLGSWVEAQRAAYAAGTLPQRNGDLLAAIPGWEWGPDQGRAAVGLSNADGSAQLRGDGRVGAGNHRADASARLHGLSDCPERRTLDDDCWQAGYAALCGYARHMGHARPPIDATLDGFAVGAWANEMRRLCRRGDLTIGRAEALEALPGWRWSVADVAWHQGLETLQRYRAAHGTANPPASIVYDGLRLGAWVATQRRHYRRGTLAESRRKRLEAVPDWTWTPRRVVTGHREGEARAADHAVSPAPRRTPGAARPAAARQTAAGCWAPRGVEVDRSAWCAG